MRARMSATTAATCALRSGCGAVVDKDADRAVVFADAVDAAGDMELGAEGDLEESVDDLGVGEGLALDRAAMGDLGVFGRRCAASRRQEPRSVASIAPNCAGQCRAMPGLGAGTAERHDAAL